MRTNINVQELTVAALMEENPEHIYHAAMLDPHTAAELDDSADATYFTDDGVHLKDAGHAAAAALIQTALAGV